MKLIAPLQHLNLSKNGIFPVFQRLGHSSSLNTWTLIKGVGDMTTKIFQLYSRIEKERLAPSWLQEKTKIDLQTKFIYYVSDILEYRLIYFNLCSPKTPDLLKSST